MYFDNAATSSPKPQAVKHAVLNALTKYCANPGRSGHRDSIKASEMVYECRSKAAGFFNAENPENIIFTNNCTESLNFILKGFLKPGDHVITSALEHNAVIRPLYKLQSDGIISYDCAKIIFGDTDGTMANFERLIRPNTRLIICTHASNVLGTRLPVERIGQLCKRNNLAFALDAAQSAGTLPIDMDKMNIDFLAAAPHKGLYAPMGIGILAARKPLAPILEGGTGTHSVNPGQPEMMPERLESGTLNLPGIAGLSAGIDFVNSHGVGSIHQAEIKLLQNLYNKLKDNPKIELYTPFPDIREQTAVLSLNIKGLQSEEVAAELDNGGFAVRSGLHCAPSAHKIIGTLDRGTVRIAPSIFTNNKQIDALAKYFAISFK